MRSCLAPVPSIYKRRVVLTRIQKRLMKYSFLTRWKYRLIIFWQGWDMYRRVFEVQTELWESSNGKRPTPDAERCRELSNRLAGIDNYEPRLP